MNDFPELVDVKAKRWQSSFDRKFELIFEKLAPEHLVHINLYPEEKKITLWAYPYDIENLILGHIGLEYQGYEIEYIKEVKTTEFEHFFDISIKPIENFIENFADAKVKKRIEFDMLSLAPCMQNLLSIPGAWDKTGCFHRAALLHMETQDIVLLCEDIGRHNCIDRISGLCLKREVNIDEYALLLSARVTASIYSKARKLGVSCIISRSAVTAQATFQAQHDGICLVGYCRTIPSLQEHRYTVFSDTNTILS